MLYKFYKYFSYFSQLFDVDSKCQISSCVPVLMICCLICVAVHLIVATPGRILDLLNKELIKMDDCKVLVLDEVDNYLYFYFHLIV